MKTVEMSNNNYLYELQKRYTELRDKINKEETKHHLAHDDEYYLLGEILKIYGILREEKI